MALRKIIELEGESYIRTGQGSFSLGTQKTAFSAYCKIINIVGDKTGGQVTIECQGEKQKITKQEMVVFSTEDGAPNFIKQAYEYLKTLPDWADATDC